MDAYHAMIRESLARDAAEREARDAAGRLRPGELRSANLSSSVFSVRLDHHEREMLQTRADVLGLKPSVLARNLIRQGLMRSPRRMTALIETLEETVAHMRAVDGNSLG